MIKLRVDLTGQKFGRLKVLKYIGRSKRKNSQWLCLCDCGQHKVADGSDLQSRNTKSCGCLRIKHGHRKNRNVSQVYTAWQQIKQRCINPKDTEYINYGGRGITVCNRWLIFDNFFMDMGNPPTKDHSIDRIDNNKGYLKSNCRWATRKQQQGNMRSNHMITFNQKTQCLAEWAREVGINQKTLWHRFVTLSWSVEKALTTPTKRIKR